MLIDFPEELKPSSTINVPSVCFCFIETAAAGSDRPFLSEALFSKEITVS